MGFKAVRFRLNKDDGKVLGVCAGIADHFGVDTTLVRVGMAISILATFPVILLGYFILAAVAESGDGARAERSPATRPSESSSAATRQRMRDLDARMAAIESYVTSSNTALAREIDELR